MRSIEAKVDALLRRTPPPPAPALPCVANEDDDDEDEEVPPAYESALTLSRKSRDALEQGDVEGAMRLATEALGVNPDSVSALRARGRARAKKGLWEGARADFSQAQRIDYDEGTEELLKEACARVKSQEEEEEEGAVGGKRNPRTDQRPAVGAGMDLNAMMSNPEVMGGVAEMLKNPDAMRAIQESPFFQSMLKKGVA